MKYEYRWFYASLFTILLCMLAFFYDFRIQWDDLNHLQKKETDLKVMLNKIHLDDPSVLVIKEKPKQIVLINDLWSLAEQHSLAIQSIQLQMQTEECETVHLVANGTFQQFYAFALDF